MFTLQALLDTALRPALYEPGDEFWNDPYISGQLLAAHLDPDTDQASYKPAVMDAICAFLPKRMELAPGAAIADLGCGPGLYCARLSAAGYALTGVDRSESSLRYAAAHAPGARFLRQSYLEPFGTAQYDAAILVSQDYGVLPPEARRTLLQNLHAALKPEGRFAFDVPSLRALKARTAASPRNWYAAEAGLFRPHPHFVLQAAYPYPAQSALCDLYTVLDTKLTTYRFWQTFFSPASITAELEQGGFNVIAVYASLTGETLRDASPSLGVLCRKA